MYKNRDPRDLFVSCLIVQSSARLVILPYCTVAYHPHTRRSLKKPPLGDNVPVHLVPDTDYPSVNLIALTIP